MRFLKWLLVILALLTIIYFLGPEPATPEYSTAMPAIPADANALINYVKNNEAQHKLKPDNEARIIWANDSLKNKTEYAIVYLHGFGASQGEGIPIHTNIAKEYGCNLYLSRLAEQGIDTVENMINLTPEEYWESAKQALAIGKQLGKKVILMTCSTGGTNALQLAAAYPDDIAGIILMSPNIAINNDKAWLLNKPWGLQIARWVTGGDYLISKDTGRLYEQYWYAKYRLEATVQLQEMIATTMTPETFAKVKQPTLLLYYYKDDVHQDSVVSVPAMLKMFDGLGTPRNMRIKESVPNAGNHVMCSYIRSHDLLSVQKDIEDFLERIMKLQKVQDNSITTVSH
jgi:pimeloyl-ACP methyl ester carboxylesterase